MSQTQPKNRGFFRSTLAYYLVALLLVLAFVGGLYLGNKNTEVVEQAEGGEVSGVYEIPKHLQEDVNFQLFWDAWDLVSKNYVDQPVNQAQLLYGAIAGMVNSLEDPHTTFFDPELNEEFLQELDGHFSGIGAEIAIKNNQLQIVSPLADLPAEKAGLRPGDFILKIDELDTQGITLDFAVRNIRGPEGSQVTLTIFRKGEEVPREVTITRANIKIDSVTYELLENKIGLIELRSFNADTTDDFRGVIDQIFVDQPKSLILDLRNDPGGFLDTAIDIGSFFIEDGVIVSEKAFDGSIREHRSKGRAKLSEYPLVVLINQGSASASEIVAGALQDYGKAKIIGMQSFGKGSVQTLFNLSDGSAIKLTIAKWLTPKGNTIEGKGITPDIIVDLTDEDFKNDLDPQLDKAIEVLTSAESL